MHCSVNSVSPTTPAMCSSRAAASASNGMCETTAYQLAPLFHTQHYVPLVRWSEQPFLKTTGTFVIIYCITPFFNEFCIAHLCSCCGSIKKLTISHNCSFPSAGRSGSHMPVRPLILSPAILVRALHSDPADLLVRAGRCGKRRHALHALRALFSMTPAYWYLVILTCLFKNV